jgi:hypothetical protein
MNRECAGVITRTGNSRIFLGGNHNSHCAASPGSHVSRSEGSTGRCSGRRRRTLSRNQVIDPVQPTPLSDHRGRHVRRHGEQLPHHRLGRRERRRNRRPLVLRRPHRGHRPRDRRPPHPQIPRNLTLRNTVRNQPPDQSPILHKVHPSNLSGWPPFSPVAMTSFSSVVDTPADGSANRPQRDGAPRGDLLL